AVPAGAATTGAVATGPDGSARAVAGPAGRAVPRVLAVAGSDPSGGAGIQADLKAVAAADGYGMTAITALTVQNTRGVCDVHVPPASFLAAQLDAVTDDVALDAVKIGMLGAPEVAEVVGAWLDSLPRGATAVRPAVVLDPVMVATSGHRLLNPGGERAVADLLRRADVVTPNLPELAVLLDEPVARDWAGALEQAARLARRHGVLVVAKGGHLDSEVAPDALVGPDGLLAQVDGPRVASSATHGTGCSLSSGLAVRYARSRDWAAALRETKQWLTRAIRAGEALEVGGGHGPVDHLADVRTVVAGSRAATLPGRLPGDVARRFAGHDGSPGTVPGTAAEDGAALVARWWDEAAGLRAQIDALPFVRALADGTLPEHAFRYYLQQDALYLREYARALARAAELAPTRAEQAFWAGGAHGALVTELDLHTSWLCGEPGGEPGGELPDVPASPTTRAYLDHLRAAGSDYATLVAAVLPCYWIYQDVGERLAAGNHDAHPYRAWLGTYADDEFAAATRQAVAVLERVAADATGEQRHRMAEAFARACRHEVAFFDQAHAWGPAPA
ncbi:bifunctional hydroxymethylpyrimidine kinase/phosphomethylpyrimidine kinase, partial [Isoptericola cucumis]|uniref:bifunctional hydroxymethylpyrimidine kinase/phosphomethylpyrimidine kinase n=1 Tax=Isoptericola cucumis TaxID=1776856 RepID=UPI003208D066